MLDYFFSFATGNGAISSEITYITFRMDSILEDMLKSPIFETLLQTFGMIGVLLMCVYFFVDLLEKASDMQFEMEIFFKQMLRFVIAYCLMTHIPELCTGMSKFSEIITKTISNGFGQGWANMAQEVNSSMAGFSGTGNYVSSMDGGSFMDVIFAMGFQVILQFATWKLSIERALKIGYKSILAPIVCADVVTNGYSSSGIKHLKSILGLYLQTVVIIIALICVDILCLKAAGTGMWAGIISLFLIKDTIKQSQEIANEIAG